ncbi:hypothetical protein [Capnocytophaga bilenii]|uniref:hypothetical protein n=1 Tax=Capnocytophaga bilenii TaxID=2819369 RepID=UPI0028D61FD7|nr:hypothetical protein [Capnocytophaga bilenii]
MLIKSTMFPATRWCELVARTPIRQFHPKVIKKTFSFSGYSLLKVRNMKLLSLFLHTFSLYS